MAADLCNAEHGYYSLWYNSYHILHLFYFVIFPGILVVYLWYQTSPSPCSPLSHAVCQRDILHLWAPVIGLGTLLLLGVLLHSWVLVIRTLRNIREKKTRIVSRALVGFVDSSPADSVHGSFGAGIELVGCAVWGSYEGSTRF